MYGCQVTLGVAGATGSIKMRSLKYTVQNILDDDDALTKVPEVRSYADIIASVSILACSHHLSWT